MTNNTSRVSQDVATKRPSSQARIRNAASPEPGINQGAYAGHEPVTLVLNDAASDACLAGADVTAAQLAAIRREAKMLGLTVGDLLADAVRYMAGGPQVA